MLSKRLRKPYIRLLVLVDLKDKQNKYNISELKFIVIKTLWEKQIINKKHKPSCQNFNRIE